jgi:hypothetical protein
MVRLSPHEKAVYKLARVYSEDRTTAPPDISGGTIWLNRTAVKRFSFFSVIYSSYSDLFVSGGAGDIVKPGASAPGPHRTWVQEPAERAAAFSSHVPLVEINTVAICRTDNLAEIGLCQIHHCFCCEARHAAVAGL